MWYLWLLAPWVLFLLVDKLYELYMSYNAPEWEPDISPYTIDEFRLWAATSTRQEKRDWINKVRRNRGLPEMCFGN